MNINRLRYLVTVVENGSIRRAAELLHITPAALSKAITSLEAETELRLLVPYGRGIRPTEAALALAQRARRVLSEVEDLEAHVSRASRERRTVRLGTFEVFGTYFLGQLALAASSDMAVAVHAMGPGDIEINVAEGIVDAGLTLAPVAHDAVVHHAAAIVTMGVFARAREWKGASLADLPFAVPTRRLQGSAARAASSDGWPTTAPLRNVAYQVGTMEAALELARQGLAACFVPTFVVDLHNAEVLASHRLDELDTGIDPIELTAWIASPAARSTSEGDALASLISTQLAALGLPAPA